MRSQAPSQNAEVKKTMPNLRIQPREALKPTGQTHMASVSIKKLLNPEDENAVQIQRGDLPFESYGFDDIKMAWHSYAFMMKEQKKENIHAALKRRDPKPKGDHTYQIDVDNSTLADILNDNLQDFTNYIRKRVKNYNVNIEINIADDVDDPNDQYISPKDKFQKMARKNPSLHSLKSIFNLDIDY